MKKSWYVVADSSGARIFEQRGVTHELTLLRQLDHPEGRLKTEELVSDRQGRSDRSNMHGRTPLGGDYDPKEALREDFANDLAQGLEQDALQEKFHYLVLVSEPHFLGLVKQNLGSHAQRKLRTSLAKDLSQVSHHDMGGHLESVLLVREPIG